MRSDGRCCCVRGTPARVVGASEHFGLIVPRGMIFASHETNVRSILPDLFQDECLQTSQEDAPPQKKRVNNPNLIDQSLRKVDREPQFNAFMFWQDQCNSRELYVSSTFSFPSTSSKRYLFSLTKLLYARKQTPHALHTPPRQPSGITLTKNRANRKLQ